MYRIVADTVGRVPKKEGYSVYFETNYPLVVVV